MIGRQRFPIDSMSVSSISIVTITQVTSVITCHYF